MCIHYVHVLSAVRKKSKPPPNLGLSTILYIVHTDVKFLQQRARASDPKHCDTPSLLSCPFGWSLPLSLTSLPFMTPTCHPSPGSWLLWLLRVRTWISPYPLSLAMASNTTPLCGGCWLLIRSSLDPEPEIFRTGGNRCLIFAPCRWGHSMTLVLPLVDLAH